MKKIFLVLFVICTPLVVVGNTVIVSTASDESLGNSSSKRSSQSLDGRYIAFDSDSTNIVAGDVNGTTDVFLKDMEAGTLRLVSASASSVKGNDESQNPKISHDGRYVVFDSAATNLVPGDTNASHDIFRKDIRTNAIVRVSVSSAGSQGNGYSFRPSISSDGRYVVFHSDATNLVAGDTNGEFDVFIRDMVNNTTTRVSVGVSVPNANDESMDAQVGTNGRYVVFKSNADNITWGDTNGVGDIFLRDMQNETTSIISEGVNGIGNGSSHEPQMTSDGKYIVFYSHSDNLVNGDTNNKTDIFLKEVGVWGIRRISTAINGYEANNNSSSPIISENGKFIVFKSYANNLVPNDTNAVADIFLKDLTNGPNSEILTRKNINPQGEQSTCGGENPSFSPDNNYLTFQSCGTDLVDYDNNGVEDIFQVPVQGSTKGNGWDEKIITNSNVLINGGDNIGYLEYLPDDYNAYGCVTQKYPVVIFLHGNAQSVNPMNLSLLKKEGLGFYVEQGFTDLQFNYGGKLHKFIGIIPQQNLVNTPWEANTIDKVVQHLFVNYRVNFDRIYIAGYSYGSLGLFEYLALSGKSNNFAAAAPIGYVPGVAPSNFCNVGTLPLRSIGEGQMQNGSYVVDPTYFTNWINTLNTCSSPVVNPPAIVDIHTNTKHDQLATYPLDPRGTGFVGESIYERFLSHERNYTSGSEGTSCQPLYDNLKIYNAPDNSFSFKYPSFLNHINYYKTGSAQNRPIYVTVGLPGQRGVFASQIVVAKGSSTASITNIFKKAVSDYRKIFRNSLVVKTENETLAINRRVKIITFGSSQASEQRKFVVAIVKDGNDSFVITARTTEADFDTFYKTFTIMMANWKFEPQS